MAILEIITYPNRLLREKSKEIKKIDNNIISLVDDMIDTMFKNKGLGLSAIQVGIPLRIFIIDWVEEREENVSDDKERSKENIKIFINPVLYNFKEKFIMENEGCLSIPGVREDVERFYYVSIDAFNLDGEKFTINAEGILAVALQHEFDHLEGKLFIDRLSPVKRNFVLKEYKKKHKKKK